MKNFFNKNIKKILFIIYLLLGIQLVLYIFVGAKSLLNSDSSFIVDYSLEQIRTGKIFPKTWVNSNDFWIYSLIPMITLFLKLGLNLFLSRQFAVFIQSLCLFFLLYYFSKYIYKDKRSFNIIALLLLSGISGQFMFEVFGDATYGSIILYMLLLVFIFIRLLNKCNPLLLAIFGIILTGLTACSLRFPVYVGAGIIVCLIYQIYVEGGGEKRKN